MEYDNVSIFGITNKYTIVLTSHLYRHKVNITKVTNRSPITKLVQLITTDIATEQYQLNSVMEILLKYPYNLIMVNILPYKIS